MPTAHNIMNAGVTCVGEHETLTVAAQRMREHDMGALPICGDDDRLQRMLTDRASTFDCRSGSSVDAEGFVRQ